MPETRIIMLTMSDEEDDLFEAIKAGASGYLLKDALPESIVSSIRELRGGGSPISPGIARRILSRFRLALGPSRPAPPLVRQAGIGGSPLTERETLAWTTLKSRPCPA